MKKLLLLILVILLLAAAALGWTFTAATLDVDDQPLALTPAPIPKTDISLRLMLTGYMESSQLFSFRGGDANTVFKSSMAAVLVQHPKGDLLIDAGFGRNVRRHFEETTPALMQNLSALTPETPAVDQLKASDYDFSRLKGTYLTHAHWDHVSGAEDFPQVPVRVPAAELAFIQSGGHNSLLARQLANTLNYQSYEFNDGPYEAWANSHDVYGDGAVVIVPFSGHTPGSVGIFVNMTNGQRYLFVGDTVWAKEGISLPAERPWLARVLVDADAAANRALIIMLHKLAKHYPQLTVVPAHDRRVHEGIRDNVGE